MGQYIYHYHATTQHGQKMGATAHLDGVMVLESRISDGRDYLNAKAQIAATAQKHLPGLEPSDLAVQTLYLLTEPRKMDQGERS